VRSRPCFAIKSSSIPYILWPLLACFLFPLHLSPLHLLRGLLNKVSLILLQSDFYFIYTTTHCSLLRLIVRSGLDVPTFATRRLHACHHARAPSGGRWNCGREMSGKFCLNADFHVTFRDLLHAVKLRHGTDGFSSPPKEGVLRIFSP